MGDAVEDKRAALKAAASAGRAGLDAYRSGQEAIKSDQRAAIDLALDGAMSRGAPSAALEQLTGTIKPYGDAAQGRIAAAGDRFGASQGELGSALGTFQSGANRVEDLAYSYAKEQAQKALDARAAREGEGGLSATEMKQLAQGLGEEFQGSAMAEAQKAADDQYREELYDFARAAFANIPEPRAKAAAWDSLLSSKTEDDILLTLERYLPAGSGALPQKKSGIVGDAEASIENLKRAAGLAGPQEKIPFITEQAYERLLADVGDFYDVGGGLASLYAPVREVEASRHVFDRMGYEALGGDPYMAAGIFGEDPGFSNDADNLAERDFYIQTGMTPSEYDEYVRDVESGQFDALDEEKARIGQDALLSPGLIESTAKDWGIDEIDLYSTVDQMSEVIAAVLAQAREKLGNPGQSADTVAGGIAGAITEQAGDLDPQYRDALVAMALDQFEVYASPYATGP